MSEWNIEVNPTVNPAPLIGLAGKKRSGKDTAATFLAADLGYKRLAFADNLREVLLESDPFVDTDGERVSYYVSVFGWDQAKELVPEIRGQLQNLGCAVRNVLGPDVWVTPVLASAARYRSAKVPVVVTDVRFPNEADAIRAAGGVIVRVTRDGLDYTDRHPSETAMDDYHVDYTLTNCGEMGAYRYAVNQLAGVIGGWIPGGY